MTLRVKAGRMRRGILALALCLQAGLAAPQAGAQERLSIEDGRKLAVALVQAGQPTAAREAARALLTRDPDDLVALLVLARAARDLGLYDEAKVAARRAHRLAPKGSADRFGASLAMAQALASDGQRGLAQLWLRRAADEAPSDGARDLALRDLAYVRWRNPLALNLQFNAFPSSNVNGGPTSNVLVIGGLEFVDPDAVPLSGYGVSAGVDARLRLWAADRDELSLGLSLDATTYVLSDSAKARLPAARGSDYGTAQAVVSFGWIGRRDWGQASARLALGRDWRGGDPQADWVRLSFGAEKPWAGLGALDVSLDLVQKTRLDSALRSSDEVYVGAGWSWALASGDRMRLGLDLGKVWSDAASVARHSAGISLSWQKAEPVWGLGLSAEASVKAVDYERPLFLLGIQHDLTTQIGVTAVLQDLDVMGFAPEVGVVLTRTQSNISTMTSETAEIRFGIRSVY